MARKFLDNTAENQEKLYALGYAWPDGTSSGTFFLVGQNYCKYLFVRGRIISCGDLLEDCDEPFFFRDDWIVYNILSNGYVSTSDDGNYKFTRFSNDLNISELNIHETDKYPIYKAWVTWLEGGELC